MAEDLIEHFEDGVYFVDLAPLSDPELVISAIAQTLSVKEFGDRPLIDILKGYLQDKQMLLLLDNFEPVVTAAPQVVELLATSPRLKVLVTSREPCHVGGEHMFSVPPLTLPEPGLKPPLSIEHLTQCESVRLFIERALAVKSDFAVTHENAPTIAEICIRLDGLPLAIELAATRINLLSPQALLERLGSWLKLLTGGARDLPARQQTLRATIDWSYDLLDDGEQMLFERLSVFVGGCTLEAAEAVCIGSGDLEEVLNRLASLVDKNLIQQKEQADGTPRFLMLETIREYGLERLKASGETETELRLAGAVGRFWSVRGYLSEGRGWLEGALKRDSGALASVQAKALRGAGMLAWRQGNLGQAVELYEEGLALFRELEDKRGIADSFSSLGHVVRYQDDYEQAAEFYEESLALWRELGGKEGIAFSLSNLGWVAYRQGDYERATELFKESITLWRELRDRTSVVWDLENLAETCVNGQPERAARLFGAAEVLREAIGFPLPLGRRAGYDRNVAAVRADLSGEAFEVAWAEGRAMTLEQAIAYALEEDPNTDG
ncbi:MAG: tetratricopeptide repeat protein [Candidatus Bipolaricaulia bacterium]